mmetsp:Transcript_24265/g.56304  ORF Transcript_24265/g.56304 Transcript_24265/m.56304 type:complete len:221 (+) Transcript_24265:909-1571(+)
MQAMWIRMGMRPGMTRWRMQPTLLTLSRPSNFAWHMTRSWAVTTGRPLKLSLYKLPSTRSSLPRCCLITQRFTTDRKLFDTARPRMSTLVSAPRAWVMSIGRHRGTQLKAGPATPSTRAMVYRLATSASRMPTVRTRPRREGRGASATRTRGARATFARPGQGASQRYSSRRVQARGFASFSTSLSTKMQQSRALSPVVGPAVPLCTCTQPTMRRRWLRL